MAKVQRTTQIEEKALAEIHTLRGKLDEIVPPLNSLNGQGIIIKFGFNLGPDGKQRLEFEALAPLNLNQ